MSKTFEEKLGRQAYQFCTTVKVVVSPNDPSGLGVYYIEGAQWGYREGIKAAIEMLKTYRVQVRENINTSIDPKIIAWLEEQFKNG